MKTLITLAIALLTANIAYAANDCSTQAADKKLSGAAKAGFVKKCVREGCDAQAAEKKLAGAAKNSFAKKCVADGMQPYCEEQAAGKKLAGAARTSFMNKCQSGK